jgi:enamine deaminase RidA (YjgF/YER057c/UK114 family)
VHNNGQYHSKAMINGVNMQREVFSSGGKWEAIVGYSRTVRVGVQVFVAGCTAADQNGQVTGDGYQQTIKTLANIEQALALAGAKLGHVVRTRMFVVDIADWQAIGRAHGEVFATIRPVATMVEVSKLIDPAMLVEIEVDAIIHALI